MSVSQIVTNNIHSFLDNSSQRENVISIAIDNHCNRSIVSFEVSENASIYELKGLIQEKEGKFYLLVVILLKLRLIFLGVSPEHVILQFNKEELHNDRKLADYGIKNEDLLISHYDLTGGTINFILNFT